MLVTVFRQHTSVAIVVFTGLHTNRSKKILLLYCFTDYTNQTRS